MRLDPRAAGDNQAMSRMVGRYALSERLYHGRLTGIAFHLDACKIVANNDMPPSSPQTAILQHVSTLLLPSASSSTSSFPPPNDHVLALRCLLVLSQHLWDGLLGEAEMGVIMEGLNSPDDTIRRLVRAYLGIWV